MVKLTGRMATRRCVWVPHEFEGVKFSKLLFLDKGKLCSAAIITQF